MWINMNSCELITNVRGQRFDSWFGRWIFTTNMRYRFWGWLSEIFSRYSSSDDANPHPPTWVRSSPGQERVPRLTHYTKLQTATNVLQSKTSTVNVNCRGVICTDEVAPIGSRLQTKLQPCRAVNWFCAYQYCNYYYYYYYYYYMV